LPFAIQSWSLTSLQQRLFKTGGRLIRRARYFTLPLAESHLTRLLFRQIVARIERLGWHPHVSEEPHGERGPMSCRGRSSGAVSARAGRTDHTDEQWAADTRGTARMASVNVPDRMNELNGGAGGSVDTVAAAIGPHRKSWRDTLFSVLAGNLGQ
jgi:hypothetical protein